MHGSCTLYLRLPLFSLLSPVSCSSSSSSSSSTCPFTLTCPLSPPPRRNSIKKIIITEFHLFFFRGVGRKGNFHEEGKNYWDVPPSSISPRVLRSRRATATFYEITGRKRAISLNALGALSSNGPLSLPNDVGRSTCRAKLLPLRRFEKSRPIFRRVALELRFFSSRVRPRYYFRERVDLIPIPIVRVVCVFPAHDETSFSLP